MIWQLHRRVPGRRPADQLDQELQQLLGRPAADPARSREAHRQAGGVHRIRPGRSALLLGGQHQEPAGELLPDDRAETRRRARRRPEEDTMKHASSASTSARPPPRRWCSTRTATSSAAASPIRARTTTPRRASPSQEALVDGAASPVPPRAAERRRAERRARRLPRRTRARLPPGAVPRAARRPGADLHRPHPRRRASARSTAAMQRGARRGVQAPAREAPELYRARRQAQIGLLPRHRRLALPRHRRGGRPRDAGMPLRPAAQRLRQVDHRGRKPAAGRRPSATSSAARLARVLKTDAVDPIGGGATMPSTDRGHARRSTWRRPTWSAPATAASRCRSPRSTSARRSCATASAPT